MRACFWYMLLTLSWAAVLDQARFACRREALIERKVTVEKERAGRSTDSHRSEQGKKKKDKSEDKLGERDNQSCSLANRVMSAKVRHSGRP